MIMKELFIKLFDLTGREAAIKRAKKISFIFWWYAIVAFAASRSDNEIARYWVGGTEFILFVMAVFAYVLTSRKYKGSIEELFGATGKFETLNSLVWIAMFTYTCYLSEGSPFGFVVPFVALTILLIGLIFRG